MRASYGYTDGAGDWYLIIDSDRCDGCAKCVDICPEGVLEVRENELDPMSDEPVAAVKNEHRKKIRYSCAPCRPGCGAQPAPCVAACEPGAISHSEGWRLDR
jgi:ferredoxin